MRASVPSKYPRAYLLWNDQYKHIYLIGKAVQTTILGEDVEMVTFRLTPGAQISYSVEADKLLTSKPKIRKGWAA